MNKTKISITIDKDVLSHIDSIIDNVYIRNRSQAIEYLAKISLGENKTAVILAGGPIERQKISETEFRPTYLVGSRSVSERAVQKLVQSGFKKIFIIARHEVLTAFFSQLKDGSTLGATIQYVEEKESNGSFSSLKCLRGKINSRFLVVYSDIIFESINLKALWETHLKISSFCTLMLTTSEQPIEKGSVMMEGTKITDFNQKTDSRNNLVFSPIFICETDVLDLPGSSLELDLFPALASRGLLDGYITSAKETHIHSVSDADNFRD